MKILSTLLLVCLLSASMHTKAQSTASIFLKFVDQSGTPIPGESASTVYPNSTEGLSFSQGSEACATGSGCPVVTSPLNFMIFLDKSVNPLRRVMYNGQTLQSVDVYFRKPGATFDYLKIHIEQVKLLSIQESGTGTESNAVSLSLAPQRIGWTYTPQLSGGAPGTPVKFGWDIQSNVEWFSF
ncbi:type VI secretion system tube protein Hcp [Flavisolibacter ginsenosidimutans]|uniref:Type VI secretion system tube protein Hcp n=1 Tax=Flavisolibacter ginsenosidimutans TaxID=661481 RepID=A0A5B8UKK8_9BACT|nr:type VI secretion system tube protein Hcp [Flavisolibacter ginsenosidimutans]QEC56942.1 type VI secretion system tube protein Hcp [Flavisolibacter ginsenosidimutans]